MNIIYKTKQLNMKNALFTRTVDIESKDYSFEIGKLKFEVTVSKYGFHTLTVSKHVIGVYEDREKAEKAANNYYYDRMKSNHKRKI